MGTSSKSEIRRSVRRRIAALTAEQRAAQSAAIAAALLDSDDIRRAGTVALFLSLPDEPQTRELLAALSAEHRIVLPRVEGDDMDFVVYSPGDLRIGAFGIEEPAGNDTVAPAEIDAMIVPGVAFTADGARLGRGRGYYDRYIARDGFRAVCIGVCFAEQIVANLPVEPHDRKVDAVVTG